MPATTPEPAPPAQTNRPRRLWWWLPRLSVRGLMILVLVVGAPVGWVARRVTILRQATATVRAAGGSFTYSDQVNDSGGWIRRIHLPRGPAWLRRVIGDEPFEEVVGVSFDARRGPIRLDATTMDAVACFGGLQSFFANGQPVEPGLPGDRSLATADLARLGGLGRLQHLRIFDIAVDPSFLNLVPTWPTLEEVTIRSWEPCIRGESLRALGRLPNLQTVVITAVASCTSDDIAPLLALPHLTQLILGRGPTSDAGLEQFARRSGVKVLNLWGTEITEPTLIALANNPALESLSFDATRLPSGALRHLAGVSKLHWLSVQLDGQSGPPGWPRSPTNRRAAPRFGDTDLDALQRVPLTYLAMMGLDATDAGVARLLGSHQLAMMTLSGRGVTDASVTPLLAQDSIAELILTDTGITDDGLIRVASHPRLNSLILLNNAHLTDRGIAALTSCRQLRSLTIRQPSVTPAALDALRLSRLRSGGLKITSVPAEAL